MQIAPKAFLVAWLGATMALSASPGVAADGSGLTPSANTSPWSRWQGRIQLSNAAPVWRAGLGGYDSTGLRPASVSLLGDYYFTDPLLGGSGGFRATSGMIVGLRTPAGPISAEAVADTSAAPYVGLGYSGLSSGGGWRYTADLGLLAQTPATGIVRFGRPTGSAADELRDSRLGPSLQLGVSYSF